MPQNTPTLFIFSPILECFLDPIPRSDHLLPSALPRPFPHLQESVLANLKSLDTLMSWVQKRKGGREVVRQAIEALQELLLTVLLPNRKLKFLEQQPVQV